MARDVPVPAPRQPRPESRPVGEVQRERRGGFFGFVQESWAELQKVEWPTQNQVLQGTVVVLVACIVGAGSKPVPLGQGEVDRILKTGAATAERPRAQVEFSLGESVKVTSGPLSDFDGEIVDVNPDQQKLKVLVDIFERQVPVELGFDQVKKID